LMAQSGIGRSWPKDRASDRAESAYMMPASPPAAIYLTTRCGMNQ